MKPAPINVQISPNTIIPHSAANAKGFLHFSKKNFALFCFRVRQGREKTLFFVYLTIFLPCDTISIELDGVLAIWPAEMALRRQTREPDLGNASVGSNQPNFGALRAFSAGRFFFCLL